MPTSILITGGDSTERLTEALKIAKEQSSHFDTLIVDTNDEKGIAASKSIIAKVSQRPFESSLSTVIVREAQNLTPEAQNALLKTLEEPPEKAQIILTAQTAEAVLKTISSRCVEITLKEVTTKPIINTPLLDNKLSKRLEEVENRTLDELILFWEEKLKKAVVNKENTTALKQLHRYNKTLLKLKKAEKFSVNKKLLNLLVALETPIEA